MKLSFNQRLRRLALSCLIAATSLAASIAAAPTALAHDTLPFPGTSVVENQNTQDQSTHDWCVWTESNTCNYQVTKETTAEANGETSVPPPSSAALTNDVQRVSRTASHFESSLAAVAATACANAGISVEQIIEPFAMVRSNHNVSPTQIDELRDWWASAQQRVETQYHQLLEEASQQATLQATVADTVADNVFQGDVVDFDFVSLVPLVDLRGDLPNSNAWSPLLASVPSATEVQLINDLDVRTDLVGSPRDSVWSSIMTTGGATEKQFSLTTVEETIDAYADSLRVLGRSILVTQSNLSANVSDALPPKASLVGSSAMIVTIKEEVYIPYDLAARDAQVISLFPLAKRPFCIRSRMELPGLPPVSRQATAAGTSVADLKETNQVALPSIRQISELAEKFQRQSNAVSQKVAAFSPLLQPTAVGQQLANLIINRLQLTQKTAVDLAALLPIAPPQPAAARPSDAGAKLLARAEIVGEEFDADATLGQWIAIASKTTARVQGIFDRLVPDAVNVAKRLQTPVVDADLR